jgi:hypothetical protein
MHREQETQDAETLSIPLIFPFLFLLPFPRREENRAMSDAWVPIGQNEHHDRWVKKSERMTPMAVVRAMRR